MSRKPRGEGVKNLLFVCVENAGRSQMAEAFAKHYGAGKIEVMSAGTVPSKEVNPVVIRVMQEKGIDISKNKPKSLSMKMVHEADVVAVMGCDAQDFCPAPLLKKVVNWELEDPKGKRIEMVRQIRDEIERRVNSLIDEIT